MKTVVFDSHALQVYFEREPGWEEVADLLTEGARSVRLLLSLVNWGEIVYITERRYGLEKAREVMRVLDRFPIEIVAADRRLTREAARLKARGGISYADCFAAALALLEDGEVATGDPEFAQLEDEISIRWISPRASE